MSAAKKAGQTLVGQMLVFVQGLLLTPLIIKVAGAEKFGTYVLLLSYMSILFGVSSMGVGISAKRWLPGISAPVERAARFYPQFWFQLVSVGFLGLASTWLFKAFIGSEGGVLAEFPPWIPLCYLLAYTLYSQTADYFRYTHRVVAFNVSTVMQPYLFVGLSLGYWWGTASLNATILVAALTLSSLTIGGLFMIRLVREIGVRLELPRRGELWREIRLGFPLMLAFLVDVILSGGDRYVIAAILSVRDVGMYAPAYALGCLAMILPRVYGVVLPPLLSQLVDSGDESGARRLSERAARLFLLVSIPFVVGATIIGKWLLQLYTNEVIAEAAWPVVPLIAVASIFNGLLQIKSNILFVRLRTGALLQINLMSAGLNILINVVLLTVFGSIVVSACATIATYLASYLLLSKHLKRDGVSYSIDRTWVLRVFISSGFMALVMIAAMDLSATRGLPLLSLVLVAGIAAYAGAILAQQAMRNEIRIIISGAARTR